MAAACAQRCGIGLPAVRSGRRTPHREKAPLREGRRRGVI